MQKDLDKHNMHTHLGKQHANVSKQVQHAETPRQTQQAYNISLGYLKPNPVKCIVLQLKILIYHYHIY